MNDSMENNKNLITGLVIIFVCLGLFAFSLESGGGYGKGSRPFFIEFDDISGLATSNKVRVEGVTVGFVESMSLSENRKARVKVFIGKSVAVHKGARAQLRTKTFLGGRFIEINPGDKESGELPAGSTIETDISPVTPNQLSAFFSRSFNIEGDLFGQFAKTIQNAEKISDSKERLLTLQNKTGKLFDDLQKLKSWYLRSEKLAEKLNQINLEKIPEFANRAEGLQKKLRKVAESITENGPIDDQLYAKNHKLKKELLKLGEILDKVANGQLELLEKTDRVLLQLLVFDEKTIRKIFQQEGISPLKSSDKIEQRIKLLKAQKKQR